jgi:putative spermidine/putrescine transport system permease protein
LLPFMAGMVYALLYSFGLAGILSKGFTTEHVKNVLESKEIYQSFLYSIYIATISIFISLSISLVGVWLYKATITKGRLSFLSYLPLALPAIVTAFLSFQFLGKSGWFSAIAYQGGFIHNLAQFPDLINDRFAIGIIITHILMAVPFFLIFFSNLYQAENLNALAEVSSSLGANRQQIASKIILPVLLKRGLNTILLYFIFILGSYEIPLILGRQSPQMISVLVVRKMQRFNLLDIPQGYFISFVYSLLVVLILFLFVRSKKTNQLWE